MQKAPVAGFFVAVMHLAVRRFTWETLAEPGPCVKFLNETQIAMAHQRFELLKVTVP
jgi:hypothetical protein